MHKAQKVIARGAVVSRIARGACRDTDINGSFRQTLQCNPPSRRAMETEIVFFISAWLLLRTTESAATTRGRRL